MRRPFYVAFWMSLLSIMSPAEAGKSDGSTTLEQARATLKGIKERGGLVLANDPFGDHATSLRYLDQGWGVLETLWYYHADQGSALIARDILVNLEQANNEQLLIEPEHMARFRFLTQHKTPNNPDGLPIGFARHKEDIGLTCAACHTGQIVYQNTAIRIDGAPALIDMIGFIKAIRDAEKATLADPQKLARFAQRLPSKKKKGDPLAAARTMLEASLAWFESYLQANASTTVEGYGRLDAVGRIVNQVIRYTSDPKYSAEPNAPTSFPLLWDAPRHDYVQWIGFAGNAGAGSLGRNVGEVVGVFGHVEVKGYKTKEEAQKGYRSTVEAQELVSMEEALHKLASPVWPLDLMPCDSKGKAVRGKELYQKNCVSCHALIDRADPNRKVTAMITGINVVGTDPTSASNLLHARAPSGKLEGSLDSKGQLFGKDATALTLLGNVVQGILTAQKPAVARTLLYSKANGLEKTPKQGDHPRSETDPTVTLMSYKARPLNGIWASSPYLHNGSVPTLYDLLLPVEQRPKQFAVGSWKFDPQKVGYVYDGKTPWVLDTTVKGNSNQGHEYGTQLSDEDRWALVEYLKTL